MSAVFHIGADFRPQISVCQEKRFLFLYLTNSGWQDIKGYQDGENTMYLLLDPYNEVFEKYPNLEELRAQLQSIAQDDSYAFSKLEVYEIHKPVKFDVLPIRVIFPEKE